MTIASLERRLRKVEAARGGGASLYAAWGRTAEEAQAALRHAGRIGAVRPRDEAIPFVWPHSDPAPRSRWISFGRQGENDIGDAELECMVDQLQAATARREREIAVAAGEHIAGLDETDFLIRSIRRDGPRAPDALRQLEAQRNPAPEVHWPSCTGSAAAIRCDCDRCRAGETTPSGAHRRHERRLRAWRDRYLFKEELTA